MNAETYRQAYNAVIKRYTENPEDHWRLQAIKDAQSGTFPHTTVMNRLTFDVEETVNIMEITDPLVDTFVKCAAESSNKSLTV